ncbi:hypothetical protein KSP40_PGU002639 [Platanthera guangdongensis]|uniref:Uncharacterized protein n=1 Tax=Platanthera guangdongensis TaxID=2320717 RepID=A0ABR2LYQ1_9ASPA
MGKKRKDKGLAAVAVKIVPSPTVPSKPLPTSEAHDSPDETSSSTRHSISSKAAMDVLLTSDQEENSSNQSCPEDVCRNAAEKNPEITTTLKPLNPATLNHLAKPFMPGSVDAIMQICAADPIRLPPNDEPLDNLLPDPLVQQPAKVSPPNIDANNDVESNEDENHENISDAEQIQDQANTMEKIKQDNIFYAKNKPSKMITRLVTVSSKKAKTIEDYLADDDRRSRSLSRKSRKKNKQKKSEFHSDAARASPTHQ